MPASAAPRLPNDELRRERTASVLLSIVPCLSIVYSRCMLYLTEGPFC